MLQDFAVRVEGNLIRLGVLDTNSHATRLMKAHAFYEKSYSIRMVLGASALEVRPSDGIYAIGSAMRG
jgi:hypothetical protein